MKHVLGHRRFSIALFGGEMLLAPKGFFFVVVAVTQKATGWGEGGNWRAILPVLLFLSSSLNTPASSIISERATLFQFSH